MRAVRGNQRGDTLVELLVAIAILGLAAVAILAGFQFSILASTTGRNQATSDAYVRTLAEAIQNSLNTSGTYTACAPSGQYLTGSVMSLLPTGFTATQTKAKIWTGSSWSASCSTTATPPTVNADSGMQQVILTVTSTGNTTHQANEQLTVILRKPCPMTSAPYVTASQC